MAYYILGTNLGELAELYVASLKSEVPTKGEREYTALLLGVVAALPEKRKKRFWKLVEANNSSDL